MTAPDDGVATLLAGAGLGVLGTSLFTGPVRPPVGGIPHQALFCLATGGPSPLMHSQRNTGPDIKRASVQVRVRSNVNDFAGGQLLARAVWSAVQRAVLAGYMSVTARESEPVYLGQDDTEHHEWSVNVETLREE